MQIDLDPIIKSTMGRIYGRSVKVYMQNDGSIMISYNPIWATGSCGMQAAIQLSSYRHGDDQLIYKMTDNSKRWLDIYKHFAHKDYKLYKKIAKACSMLYKTEASRKLFFKRICEFCPVDKISNDLSMILDRVCRYMFWTEAYDIVAAEVSRAHTAQVKAAKMKAYYEARKATLKNQKWIHAAAKQEDLQKAQAALTHAKKEHKLLKSRIQHQLQVVNTEHKYDTQHFGRMYGRVISANLLIHQAKNYAKLIRLARKNGQKVTIKVSDLLHDFPIGAKRAKQLYEYLITRHLL